MNTCSDKVDNILTYYGCDKMSLATSYNFPNPTEEEVRDALNKTLYEWDKLLNADFLKELIKMIPKKRTQKQRFNNYLKLSPGTLKGAILSLHSGNKL